MYNADMAHFTTYTTYIADRDSVYLLLRMTCTDGGEDNSPVHDTYQEFEDQVTLGSDLLTFGRVYITVETNSQLGVFVYLASGLRYTHT